MTQGCGLEGLSADRDADIQNDRHSGFDGDHFGHKAKQTQQAACCHHQAIQQGIPRPGTEGFPGWMADVDRGGETGPQNRGREGADPIDQQGWPGRITISRGCRTFKILKRSDHVEQAHRQDDAHPGNQLATALPEGTELEGGEMKAHRSQRVVDGV